MNCVQLLIPGILPLDKLQQLENLEADDKSLELSFEEGIYSYCELQFESQAERTRFIECIMKQHESVEKTKNDKTASEPLNRLKRQMDDIATLLVSLHNKTEVTRGEKQDAMDRLTETLKANRSVKRSRSIQRGKKPRMVSAVLATQKREKEKAKKKAKKKSRSMHINKAGGGGETKGEEGGASPAPSKAAFKRQNTAPIVTTSESEEMPLTPARERRKSRMQRLGAIRTRQASGGGGATGGGGGRGLSSAVDEEAQMLQLQRLTAENLPVVVDGEVAWQGEDDQAGKEVKSSSPGKQEVKSSSPESINGD